MSEQETRFTLRIDTKLFEQIKAIAKKNKRSAAKQIEFILEEHINTHKEEI